ncbi:MAG: hypothetical protein JNM80_15490 [Phycisphaerae bacterium]|nr:hypothetical protein [Phycisphaerae bacterium]
MTSLAQIAQNKKQQARAAFIEAAWAEAPLEHLADLARDAGLEPSAADTIIARIAEARGDMKPTREIPRLRRAAAKTKADAEATRARIDAAVEKLEAEADAASSQATAAWREMIAADSAAQRLLALHDQGLLPATRLPKEVLALVERRDKERHATEAHATLIAATNERSRLRGIVDRLESELLNLPASREQPRQAAILEKAVARAKADLAAAEDRLADAERTHAAARSAL